MIVGENNSLLSSFLTTGHCQQNYYLRKFCIYQVNQSQPRTCLTGDIQFPPQQDILFNRRWLNRSFIHCPLWKSGVNCKLIALSHQSTELCGPGFVFLSLLSFLTFYRMIYFLSSLTYMFCPLSFTLLSTLHKIFQYEYCWTQKMVQMSLLCTSHSLEIM